LSFVSTGMGREAGRKKRALFPEDKIDAYILFHSCLLPKFGIIEPVP
jgi:hypothetical protein